MASTRELLSAIGAGDVDAVRALLTDDPSLAAARDDDGVSALMHARYRFDAALTDAVLAHVRELDVFEAATFGGLDRLAVLLSGDPWLATATSGDGFTPLHLAAFFGKDEAVRLLIDRGADVDARGTGWMKGTALHSAASGNHIEVMRALLDAGADPNTKQSHGFVPLHAVAQNGSLEGVDLLLAHGADPKVANGDGDTPADLARRAGHDHVATRFAGEP